MKRIICIIICIISLLCLLCACQKTPEQPIVIGKTNDGWKEEEISVEETVELGVPEEYAAELQFKGLTVNINAEVDVPEEQVFPVYILTKDQFTQEQADKIVSALIGDAELYDISKGRTKAVIQEEIDYYTEQIERGSDYPETIESFHQKLNELIREKETAPETETVNPASRILEFKEDQGLESSYAKQVWIAEDAYQYIWTDETRKKAAADGNAQISGYADLENGRKYLSIENRPKSISSVWFGKRETDELSKDVYAPIGEEEAVKIANELMDKLGSEYEYIGIAKPQEEVPRYKIMYCRKIPGTRRIAVETAPIGNQPERYSPPLTQESICVFVSGSGITDFYWEAPQKYTEADSANMQLLEWSEISAIIEIGLEIKNLWDVEDSNVIERRLEISDIILSYHQVYKESDLSASYYIPVWDVIGTMTYRYAEDYSPENGGFIVDENNERIAYENCSVLTVNAIDGTIIDRRIGY